MVDIRLVRDVSGSVSRVLAGLATTPMHAAHQADTNTACDESFAHVAVGHADMLEREARSIREAVERYHRQSAA